FFSSRRRHTRFSRDWSSDVCSSDLGDDALGQEGPALILPSEERLRQRGEPEGLEHPPFALQRRQALAPIAKGRRGTLDQNGLVFTRALNHDDFEGRSHAEKLHDGSHREKEEKPLQPRAPYVSFAGSCLVGVAQW